MDPIPEVTVRPAVESDIAFLTDVSIDATRDQGRLPVDFDEAEFRIGFADWTREQIRGEMPGSTTSVIELSGRPVGRLRVVRTPELIELAGVQLLPPFQGQGIGTLLIRGLMSEAEAAGLRFELGVEKDNPRARALYERLGLVWIDDSGEEDRLAWPAPH